MDCTRDDAGSGEGLPQYDGLGELISVAFGALYLLHWFAPHVFGMPWEAVCAGAGLEEGCRARGVALVLVRPIDALAEMLGFGAPEPEHPLLSLNLAILGVLLLTAVFLIGLCCFADFGPGPAVSTQHPPCCLCQLVISLYFLTGCLCLQTPIYFRRTTGPASTHAIRSCL